MSRYEVEINDAGTFWKLEGKHHRKNGPAIELANGSKFWVLYGKLHREDGPAIEYVSGDKFWYLNDINVTEQEFNNYRALTINKV